MNHKKNILFVVHRFPYPPDRGDRIRSFHLLKFLSQRANVWLATLADEKFENQSINELESYCQEVAVEHLNPTRYLRGLFQLASGNSATEGMFFSKKLRETVKKWAAEIPFDAVLGFCSSVSPYLDIPELQNTPRFIDLVDVDSEKFLAYAEEKSGLRGKLYGLEAKRLRNLEIRLGHECAGVSFVTAPEAEIFRAFMPSANIRYATNGIDLDYFDRESNQQSENNLNTKDGKTCLFVGALDYPPNVEGIRWFYSNVWNTIHERHPLAKLLVVGRNPVQEIADLNGQLNIQVHANVPDVRPFYLQADIAIAPLKIARGLQNKILEAFAMQIPVLATPSSLEGISTDNEHAMVAKDVNEWIHNLEILFGDETARTTYATSGFKFVQQNHSWETCLQPVAELLEI